MALKTATTVASKTVITKKRSMEPVKHISLSS